jgi:hypothetical protein
MKALILRFRKPLLWSGVLFAVLIAFAFLGVPPLLKSILIKNLSATLHRQVTIQKIQVNPFTLSLTVKGLLIKDGAGSDTFASFEELYVNLESFSLLRWAVILKEITVNRPFISIVRHQDNSYNFSDLLRTNEQQRSGTTQLFRFSLNNISIIGGGIDFWDEPTQKKHTVRDANISIPFISTIPSYVDIYVQPAFSARINDAEYSLKGKAKPFAASHETTLDINIDNLDIPYYLAYLPFKTDFKILSAFMDARAQILFVQHTNGQRALTLKGDLAFKKISINDAEDGSFLKLPLLDISIASSEPLSRLFHLARLSVQSPELHFRRDKEGTFNIDSLFPRRQGTQAVPGGESKAAPISIEVDDIQMMSGRIAFTDLSRTTPFKTILSPIELKISNFSNGKDKQAHFSLLIRSEVNENIKLDGNLSVDPLLVKGRVDLKSIPIRKYSPYYADNLLFDVESGVLQISSQYSYAGTGKDQEAALSDLSVSVNSLRLKKRDETGDFLNIPIITIRNTAFDQVKRELRVGEVVTNRGSILVRRLGNGALNVLTLLAPSSSSTTQAVQGKPAQAEQPWLVNLGKFSADKYIVTAEDRMPADPVTLRAEDVRLRAESLSTKEGQRGRVSLSFLLNEKGRVLTEGSVGVHPLYGRLALNVKDIDIRPLQSYITDRVKIIVTNGAVSTSGNLSLTDQKGTGLQTTYRGDTSLSQFSSIDKAHAEDFLTWESLYLGDLDVGYNPTYVHINTVALADFYARLIIHPDGSLNLQKIIEAKSGEPEPVRAAQSPTSDTHAGTPDKAGRDLRIEKVTLQGGRINVTDRSVKPNYSAILAEIGGRISGLSSEESALADVELRGKLNDDAPLEITGKINPLREDLFIDLKARFKDLDLSSVTPYSGKYIGYTIQKGKLSFDVSYKIVKGKLDSQNNVFFDQLTLGDRVESPSATNLPVRFAIALLKDRRGEIRLDLPVTGSLRDPKFDVWGVIKQILTNLFAKAATSPFALLGAAFGGGEELGYLDFDYGSAAISEPNLKKLDTLIKALYERPSLKLEIEGHADVEKDKEGLRQYLFSKKLKVQKLNERLKQGLPAIPIDDLIVEPKEYEKYLTMAYKAEKFPKPKNILGFAKSLPVPEMEKLMLTNIEIRDDDLRSLASQRAMKVKGMILKSGKIEPERLFIIEPKSLSPERHEKAKDSRVDFKIT